MNLIQFLSMKLHQGIVFIDGYGELNRGRSLLQDEFRKGRPKSVVVAETTNALHQLIFQDRHVTYREIELTLVISVTSIHSILHGYLTIKKICSRWIPHNLLVAQKRLGLTWQKCFNN